MARLARRCVLVVEDDLHTQCVYGMFFEHRGYRVVFAGTGAEGLRIAGESRPDAILMDLSIPEMDGWAATERLKADPETASIPVIVLTGHESPEARARALAAGCDGILTKPCRPQEALDEILRLIGA